MNEQVNSTENTDDVLTIYFNSLSNNNGMHQWFVFFCTEHTQKKLWKITQNCNKAKKKTQIFKKREQSALWGYIPKSTKRFWSFICLIIENTPQYVVYVSWCCVFFFLCSAALIRKIVSVKCLYMWVSARVRYCFVVMKIKTVQLVKWLILLMCERFEA